MQTKTDNNTLENMISLLKSDLAVITLQMKFVIAHLADCHHAIMVLQKATGGVVDLMGLLVDLQAGWRAVADGQFAKEVQKSLANMNSAQAGRLVAQFKACGKALVDKVDNLTSKVIKKKGVDAARSLASFNPASLETSVMVSSDVMCKSI